MTRHRSAITALCALALGLGPWAFADSALAVGPGPWAFADSAVAVGPPWAFGATPQQTLETMRIRGQVLVEAAGPLEGARIVIDAIRGPNASQFVGPRGLNARTGRNGEWSLLGATRGLWIFEVTALEHAPHVIVVPIAMMEKPGITPWDTSLAMLPMSVVAPTETARTGSLRYIVDAIEKSALGDRAAAREALLRIEDTSLSPEALCAAGDVALLVRHPSLARKFFDLAAAARPDWYRPHLGIASASLMMFDFDRAMKAFGPARAGTANKRLERMISGAIRDLQQIRTIGKTAGFVGK